MGLFNKNLFKEIEEGLKNIKQNIKTNLQESLVKKEVSFKCKGCGANIVTAERSAKCEYCGLINENEQYSASGIFKNADKN